MSTHIERRVRVLEQSAGPEEGFRAIVARIVSPGPAGPVHQEPIGYRHANGTRWLQADGEAIDDTLERAIRKCRQDGPCIPLLIELGASEVQP